MLKYKYNNSISKKTAIPKYKIFKAVLTAFTFITFFVSNPKSRMCFSYY